MSPITAIVLTYQRPRNLPFILEAIYDQKIAQDVIVWNNSTANSEACHDLKERFPDVRIAGNGINCMCFGRFVACSMATTKYVFTCDDDVLPGDIRTLLVKCETEGRVATYLDASHVRWAAEHYKLSGCSIDAHETLLGWGSVFERSWVSVLLSYIAFFGKADDVFVREADRIFTLLLQQKHCEIEAEIEHLPGARSADAMYRQPDHKGMGEIARDRCRTLLAHTNY